MERRGFKSMVWWYGGMRWVAKRAGFWVIYMKGGGDVWLRGIDQSNLRLWSALKAGAAPFQSIIPVASDLKRNGSARSCQPLLELGMFGVAPWLAEIFGRYPKVHGHSPFPMRTQSTSK